ncbi:hypothetical protein DR999_PMT20863 [Platysternon megacephalum]|uniref:Uncharacterized protein n=1 Tax=Platysternon megacephalum TaxID=55544 RepID=A0A4D9DJ06_9SAUR|nr:hypothetical protein DR999_PMT20863 [Platysternon megacephalum]
MIRAQNNANQFTQRLFEFVPGFSLALFMPLCDHLLSSNCALLAQVFVEMNFQVAHVSNPLNQILNPKSSSQEQTIPCDLHGPVQLRNTLDSSAMEYLQLNQRVKQFEKILIQQPVHLRES